MRVFRAALWIIGVPNLVGMLSAIGLGTMLAKVFPQQRRTELLAILDVFSGMVTVATGVWMARHLGMNPSVWLPFLAGSWFAVHFTMRNQMTDFIYCSVGVLGGWWCYVVSI